MDPGQELVDIIDEAGNTVATVTRRAMRAQRLPHRCTYLLVFNRRGELFIHLRTAQKDVYPAYWDVAVGGVLAAGESFDKGARRELLEELGIETEPEPLFPFRYSDASLFDCCSKRRLRVAPPRLLVLPWNVELETWTVNGKLP